MGTVLAVVGQKKRPTTVSLMEAVILEELRAGEMNAVGLVDATHGVVSEGTVYHTLYRMRDKKLVTSWVEPVRSGQTGKPRRWWSVTGFGRRVYKLVKPLLDDSYVSAARRRKMTRTTKVKAKDGKKR